MSDFWVEGGGATLSFGYCTRKGEQVGRQVQSVSNMSASIGMYHNPRNVHERAGRRRERDRKGDCVCVPYLDTVTQHLFLSL